MWIELNARLMQGCCHAGVFLWICRQGTAIETFKHQETVLLKLKDPVVNQENILTI